LIRPFPPAAGPSPETEPPPNAPAVEVIPLEPVPLLACEIAAANVQAILGLPAAVLPAWDHPDDAYLPTRNQYDAARILKKLENGWQQPRLRIAITSQDLCLPILTYVFGEARVGGHLAVGSLFRIARNPDGSRAPQALLYDRLTKVVLHEVAHALGLEHCRVEGCLMGFSAGIEHLDALTLTFCPACTRELFNRKRNLFQKTGPPSKEDRQSQPT
jgi:archaemetzincin